ncbi:MAG: hypothetical protein M3O03_07585 [Pseudomonadota bacterium]|nr:hypothetical protein [Pseudomonadota bacterium]
MTGIQKLCFAAAILIATSSTAYGQLTPSITVPPPKVTPPPPQESHNIFGDEFRYGPIGGAKSKPQVIVLGRCRIKYSKAMDIHAEWGKRFGRTGWWCAYKPKRM